MQVPTLVEPVSGHGFRAMTGSPFDIRVEAASRDDAVRQVQETLRQRFADGAEIVTVESDAEPHPWEPFAGGLSNHPLRAEWQKAMADYRAMVDQEAGE